ncbi:MAG: PIN domain-containing protein [Chloroflexota bacterium]
MVDALVDTSVIVDIVRGYQPALQWSQTKTENVGVTHFVWLEIIQGAANKSAQENAITLLRDFRMVPIAPQDTAWATTQLIKVSLSHNVDALDALIAAPAARLQVPLYTRNLKHFQPLLGKLAVVPYT